MVSTRFHNVFDVMNLLIDILISSGLLSKEICSIEEMLVLDAHGVGASERAHRALSQSVVLCCVW